jgi:hypothetical protein
MTLIRRNSTSIRNLFGDIEDVLNRRVGSPHFTKGYFQDISYNGFDYPGGHCAYWHQGRRYEDL